MFGHKAYLTQDLKLKGKKIAPHGVRVCMRCEDERER